MFFFFKQKTAYEMRISDWSSDVCSSDLNTPSISPRARSAPAAATPASSEKSPGRTSGAASPSRSEEHTSELQSLMRTSYAVFCLKKKTPATQSTLPPTADPRRLHSYVTTLQ